MRHRLLILGSLALAACSAGEPTANLTPTTSLKASLAGTYVLTQWDTSKAAPFVYDNPRMCGVNHDIYSASWILGDTIFLNSDGTALHASNGRGQWGNEISETKSSEHGQWDLFNSTGYWFYGGYTTISVNEVLGPSAGVYTTVQMLYRVNADGTLGYPAEVGGSCVGSPEAHLHTTNPIWRKVS